MSCTGDDDAQLQANTGNAQVTCAALATNNLCNRNCGTTATICCSSCASQCAGSVPGGSTAAPPPPVVAQPWAGTGESILSAINGYRQCIGVPDTTVARANGCVFTNASCTGSCDWNVHFGVPACNGEPHEVTNAGLLAPLQLACPTITGPADGFVVTFSSPIVQDSLDASDLQVTLSDSSTVVPDCVNLGPANEPNELETILAIGQFNTGGAYPVAVDVVGQLLLQPARPAAAGTGLIDAFGMRYSASDMDYHSSRIILLRARFEPLDSSREAPANPLFPHRFPNDCHSLFPTATHRISLLFNGGVTLDGWHNFLPSASGTTSPVVPLDAQGNQMAFLGLADLDNYVPTSNCEGIYRGDGDNYLDIW